MARRKTTTRWQFRLPKFHAAPFVGIGVMALTLALFNAQLVAASALIWLTPSSVLAADSYSLADITIPTDGRSRLLIPKISVEAAVVYGMPSVQQSDVQRALEKGVLHFGGSALPGQPGNAIYVGHSSNQPWAPGEYKYIFSLLDKLDSGDSIYLYRNNMRYIYQVTEKQIVKPTNVAVLENTAEPTATFVTCYPVGTNSSRLVVKARLIYPLVTTPTTEQAPPTELHGVLPGSSYGAVQAVTQYFR